MGISYCQNVFYDAEYCDWVLIGGAVRYLFLKVQKINGVSFLSFSTPKLCQTVAQFNSKVITGM